MAVPFRRTSKTKKRMRRTHYKIEGDTLIKCPQCQSVIKPHRACLNCGYYKGKEVIKKEEKATK